ncbi:MAG: cytochrome c maturation protein CcmE [Gammaproteobacteria bacterium]|jgi:cytochrome c-type biogenesis protein CcmE|tara:strand:+ start:301 stop:699 length:399 start_codon:yes stop_codon:yes gene_type:complete
MKQHRKKRLINILLISLLSGSGVLMVLYALNTNLDYFYTPSEIISEKLPSNKRVKVGGMVREGSVIRNGEDISFVITDYEESISVQYKGIVPDLFKEGSGVVALGYLENNSLKAEKVLAKHDENYMPPALNK